MPLFVLHKNQCVVASDTCVIYQHSDIVVGVVLLPRRQNTVGSLAVCHVESHQLSLTACRLYKAFRLLGSSSISVVVYQNRITHLREFEADGSAYSARPSCYQSVLHSITKSFISS